MTKKHKKRIGLKIFLSILALLILAVGIFATANRELVGGAFDFLKNAPGNNLKAAWIFLTGNSDTIQQQISDNDAGYHDAVQKIAEELGDENALDLSEYTLGMLNSGTLSEKEMVKLLLGAQNSTDNGESESIDSNPTSDDKTSDKNDTGSQETPSNPTPDHTSDPSQGATVPDERHDSNVSSEQDSPSAPTDSTHDKSASQNNTSVDTSSEEIAACIAKLYVLKSNFTGQLTSMETEIINAYESLPKEEHTPASRKKIAGQYIKTVANLEVQCDAQVDSLLSELTEKLTAQGKDAAAVDTLRQSYENEKSLKKAYYLDVYMNGI